MSGATVIVVIIGAFFLIGIGVGVVVVIAASALRGDTRRARPERPGGEPGEDAGEDDGPAHWPGHRGLSGGGH